MDVFGLDFSASGGDAVVKGAKFFIAEVDRVNDVSYLFGLFILSGGAHAMALYGWQRGCPYLEGSDEGVV